MIEKLRRHGMKEDSQTALQNIHDALGIRVICSFVEDVYQIARWLQERDGYRSRHLIIQFTTDDLEGITAEIQLHTIAIDFWAALEHQIKYKHNVPHEEIIRSELKRCADEIASVDLSMQTIRDILQNDIWEQA